MSVTLPSIRQIGAAIARAGPVRRAALRSSAGRDLVLLYHRVGDEARDGIVPTVSAERLRAHLEVLQRSGRVVPLPELLDPPDGPGPRFALTFDDDYATHAAQALPVLADGGLTATFFVCGRALHGLGAPWWVRLEALVSRDGTRAVADRLGLAAATPTALAAALEADPERQDRIPELCADGPQPLGAAGIRELAAAGMEIGYHTLHHPLLTTLGDAALEQALSEGRQRLADEVGGVLEHFAYPHGKADRRVAAAARRAGYRAAWTGWPAPLRADANRFLLPRWEPGRLDPGDFAAALVIRLHRTAPEHREALRG